ncbi:hypothetical protein [Sinomonas albida]|uniref:hypothetical protein n=1 Tax=Sinomonas albida TaxID=369942 RepID=UPI001457CAE3|nr:hypothetical protein [Sinomonas albida]
MSTTASIATTVQKTQSGHAAKIEAVNTATTTNAAPYPYSSRRKVALRASAYSLKM